jgi:hypothetical protein
LLARLRFVLLFVSGVTNGWLNQCRESTKTSIRNLPIASTSTSRIWTIEQKIALVNALGKWVAIKNKLIDAMEGEKLDEFRARLRQGDALKGVYVQRVDYEQKSRAGRKGMAKRWGKPDPESFDGTGEQLSEFKKRIPRADESSDG